MYRQSACNTWENIRICFLGKEKSFSHHCDSLLFAATCIGIKNSIINSKRNFVYFCEGRHLCQSSSFEPSYIQKALSKIGAQHEVLLYHTEVRWLSKDHVLKRLMELKKEVPFFFRKKQNPFLLQFDCKEFLYGLAYSADIFSHLNEVKLSIQGPDLTIMDATKRLQAFQAKFPLWKRKLD